jgi:hypothetical protein
VARPGAAGQPAGLAPLPPRKKWRAITVATLVFIPGYWFLVNGLVAAATGAGRGAGPLIAFGLASVPFVFMALAFLSEHPRAPGATAVAMALALLAGIPVSALARDAVTGIVAGMGAGGLVALRADLLDDRRNRALAVAAVSVFVFLLLRVESTVALLLAPALPFTAVGVADHLRERRAEDRPTGP